MGYSLHREVRAHLADSKASSLERMIALQIAIEADDQTRACQRFDKRSRRQVPTVTVNLLMRWAGVGEETVSEMLRRLSGRGLEMRRVLRKDKNGRPMYAYKGHATEFVVPPLATIQDS